MRILTEGVVVVVDTRVAMAIGGTTPTVCLTLKVVGAWGIDGGMLVQVGM